MMMKTLLLAGAASLSLCGAAGAFELGRPTQTGGAVLVAQADPAQLQVRVDQLEAQIRELTGQVEGLTFQLQQMQQLLTRMQGGGDPAPAPAGAPPIETAPPTVVPEQGVRPLPGEQEFDPTFDDATRLPSGAIDTPSRDPLLDPNGARPAALGELPVELSMLEAQPINLSFTPGAATENPDADAQFNAAYEAMVAGDHAFAADQFAQFMALYPDDSRRQDAANWLGEALLMQGEYSNAAEVLLDGYTAAPESPRAPDLMLRLGIALARAEERETACRTFSEIPNRFPNLTSAFSQRLDAERAGAECPPA
jgi:tol-pal system protein YbgF